MIPFAENTTKCQLIYSDSSRSVVVWVQGELKELRGRIIKGNKDLLEEVGIVTLSVMMMLCEFIHMSKLVKLYTSNMCSVLYVNYISIKLFLKHYLLKQTYFFTCLLFLYHIKTNLFVNFSSND